MIDEDIVKALKHRMNYSILENKKYRKVLLNLKNTNNDAILLNEENPNLHPSREISDTNPISMSITDRERINNEFQNAIQKI